VPRFWLLVPAQADLIGFLATFEVEHADTEPDNEREADSDADSAT
jgi:hypothetical protein